MNKPLNIPIKSTTRHVTRRVVFGWTGIIVGIIAACAGLFIWSNTLYIIEATSDEINMVWYMPSMRGEYNTLISHIGHLPALPSVDISWQELLDATNGGEMSVYFNDTEPVAVLINGQYTCNQRCADHDVQIYSLNDQYSLITTQSNQFILGTDTAPQLQRMISWVTLLPWNDAGIQIQQDTDSTQIPVRINENGIRIASASNNQKQHDLQLSDQHVDTIIRGSIPFVEHSLDIYAASPELSALVQVIPQEEAYIEISQDTTGIQWFIEMPSPSYSVDELATILNDWASRLNLSTSALTIDSETEVLELRANSDLWETEVSNQQDYIYIRIHQNDETLLRATQTNEQLIISNGEISPLSAKNLTETVCRANQAHTYISLERLMSSVLVESPSYTNTPYISQLFAHISIDSSHINLCW